MRSPLVHALPCAGLTVPTPRRTAYETLVRPVLFRIDPERAHQVVMAGMIALSWAIGMIERAGNGCERWADLLERRKARRQR